MLTRIVRPARRIRGRLRPGGDKSISHRYALLAALADGKSLIRDYGPGADCAATLSCLAALGVRIRHTDTALEIWGRGIGNLQAPTQVLDAANSGTTLRLLLGILAGHRFDATLTGDASLRQRPVERVLVPLREMGAHCTAVSDRPPVVIRGGPLRAIAYQLPIASAQVKSAILLAGLHADGSTRVAEPLPTRDHTERALRSFGAKISTSKGSVAIEGGQRLQPVEISVPGDPSSAASVAAAAAALSGSDVELLNVCVNPTRTAVFEVLARAGALVESVQEHETIEPIGRIRVRAGDRLPVRIQPSEVPALIDELPLLGALAAHGGELIVHGAGELRVKESDRITTLACGLRAFGASVEEWDDGFRVRGSAVLRGASVDAQGDHRLAMAFAIVALGAREPSCIRRADVSASWPSFFEALEAMCEY